jgi:hypothetical protein
MATYHVELRCFPRSAARFNQTGQQIGAIALPWVQDRVFEVDGEKWAPYDSQITIIEGPEIPLSGISMGRGWATAKREGTDVTKRVLAEAHQALADGSAGVEAARDADVPAAPAEPDEHPTRAGSGEAPALDVASLPAELDGLLGADPGRLLAAWHAVGLRTSGLAPSEALALAERELQRGEGRRR